MDASNVRNVVEELGELELALLICLLANEHCIIRASKGLLHDVLQQVEGIARKRFELSTAVIECSPETTVDEFNNAVLRASVERNGGEHETHSKTRANISSETSQPGIVTNDLGSRTTVNVVIAIDLNRAHTDIQIQALELMRSHHIHTNSAIHVAPKPFLFIALIPLSSQGPPFFTPHLNDYFFISHTVADSDATHSSGKARADLSETASISSQTSVIRHHRPNGGALNDQAIVTAFTPITPETLTHLHASTLHIRRTAEILRYTHNITTFLRLHRAVAGGVSALASRHFLLLTRILPPLSTPPLTYIPPHLVRLAALKIFPHRVQLATSANERSLQWGSDVEAVKEFLRGVESVESVVREVVDGVECPL